MGQRILSNHRSRSGIKLRTDCLIYTVNRRRCSLSIGPDEVRGVVIFCYVAYSPAAYTGKVPWSVLL